MAFARSLLSPSLFHTFHLLFLFFFARSKIIIFCAGRDIQQPTTPQDDETNEGKTRHGEIRCWWIFFGCCRCCVFFSALAFRWLCYDSIVFTWESCSSRASAHLPPSALFVWAGALATRKLITLRGFFFAAVGCCALLLFWLAPQQRSDSIFPYYNEKMNYFEHYKLYNSFSIVFLSLSFLIAVLPYFTSSHGTLVNCNLWTFFLALLICFFFGGFPGTYKYLFEAHSRERESTGRRWTQLKLNAKA